MNENPLCKCGCGKRVVKPNNKYILGHNKTVMTLGAKEKQRERTYEELYGEEKAQQVKKNYEINPYKKRVEVVPEVRKIVFES